MSVINIVGKPRTGKSYHAVATKILPALKQGRRVVTTIAGINPAALAVLAGRDVDIVVAGSDAMRDPASYPKLDDSGFGYTDGTIIKGGDLVVFDEVFSLWPRSRLVADKLPPEISDYYRHHGKFTRHSDGLSSDIVLITHAIADIHDSIIPVVELTIEIINRSVYFGSRAGSRYNALTYLGRDLSKDSLLSRQTCKILPEICLGYRSFAGSQQGKLQSRPMPARMRSLIVLAVVVLGVFIAFGINIARNGLLPNMAAQGRAPSPATVASLVGPDAPGGPVARLPKAALVAPVSGDEDSYTPLSPSIEHGGRTMGWGRPRIDPASGVRSVVDGDYAHTTTLQLLVSAGWKYTPSHCGYRVSSAQRRQRIDYLDADCALRGISADEFPMDGAAVDPAGAVATKAAVKNIDPNHIFDGKSKPSSEPVATNNPF